MFIYTSCLILSYRVLRCSGCEEIGLKPPQDILKVTLKSTILSGDLKLQTKNLTLYYRIDQLISKGLSCSNIIVSRFRDRICDAYSRFRKVTAQ